MQAAGINAALGKQVLLGGRQEWVYRPLFHIIFQAGV
jgi:hypothetical protein